MEFRLGELFSGPGGIASGALSSQVEADGEVYSISHTWANDYDKDTCDTYIKNICPENPQSVICKDVRKLDITKLEPIDALAFGFPCNDFSIVGEQRY
jgi:DNA (cytosine-5)-methyltransferase 1